MATTQVQPKRPVSKSLAKRRAEVLRLDMPGRKQFTGNTGFPGFGNAGGLVVKGKDPGVWNLWRDGVTSTLLHQFATDRGATKIKYVDGWTAKSVPMGIAFGLCVHDVLYWMYGAAASNRVAHVDPPGAEIVESHISKYKAIWRANNPDPDTDALQQQELVYGYANAVLPAYFQRWDGDFTGTYTKMLNTVTHPASFLSLEEEFRAPYTYPDGMVVWIRGKRDMVFLDRKGNEWIQDTKCLSIIQDKEILRFFPIDQQQNLYLYARLIENIRAGKGAEAMPSGCIKNVIRRPAHRQKQNEALPDFFKRIKADVDDIKQWDVKDNKGTTGWFVRYEMQLAELELLDWAERWLDPLMADLRMWYEGKTPNYSTEQGMTTKYGPSDAFAPVVDGNFNNVYQRGKPFPELAAA